MIDQKFRFRFVIFTINSYLVAYPLLVGPEQHGNIISYVNTRENQEVEAKYS